MIAKPTSSSSSVQLRQDGRTSGEESRTHGFRSKTAEAACQKVGTAGDAWEQEPASASASTRPRADVAPKPPQAPRLGELVLSDADRDAVQAWAIVSRFANNNESLTYFLETSDVPDASLTALADACQEALAMTAPGLLARLFSTPHDWVVAAWLRLQSGAAESSLRIASPWRQALTRVHRALQQLLPPEGAETHAWVARHLREEPSLNEQPALWDAYAMLTCSAGRAGIRLDVGAIADAAALAHSSRRREVTG